MHLFKDCVLGILRLLQIKNNARLKSKKVLVDGKMGNMSALSSFPRPQKCIIFLEDRNYVVLFQILA